jgi:hypothetical protein
MVAQLETEIITSGMNLFDTNADRITVCQAEPTTYALATTGHLGLKSWAAGGAFGVPASAGGNGMKVSSTVVSDGTILTTGTASWWAVVNSTGLLAHGLLSASQAVTATNTFTLASFDITIPAH